MALSIPAIFVACLAAWLITRKTGPLLWWSLAGGLQVLLQFLWTGVLAEHARLNGDVAITLASGLGVVTVVMMSVSFRFLRRHQRPHEDPRSQIVRHALRRNLVVSSIVGGVFIFVRIAIEVNRPPLPPIDAPRFADDSPLPLELLQPTRATPPAGAGLTPRQEWRAGADRLAKLMSFRASFIEPWRRDLPGLEAGPVFEETLPFAEHIRVELVAPGRNPILGWGDVYLTDKGILYLVSLADPASYSNPRSAFSRAVSRINAIVPDKVDAAPADYIQLDSSWRRDTTSVSPVGSVVLLCATGRSPNVRFAFLAARYTDTEALIEAAGRGRQ